ncbi:hypothetical protein JR316_0002089 [Psilocybe cubensis]|nr:hypothetical protein JR316_0002089 [Psilocybe cubensis]KAH9485182.1 hypothetical protein JR316_0002089 [Psilocybe cubensis]
MPSVQRTYLYIPDDSSPNQPIEQKTISAPSVEQFTQRVHQLLKCELAEDETILSPEYLAIFEGHGNGLPTGTEFTIYVATMDENGNATRPLNSRAARLLRRPKSHGPMLIFKAVYKKQRVDAVLRHYEDSVGLERELEGTDFQEKRQDFIQKREAYMARMIEDQRKQGVVVLTL